jgi:hypothetical protein
MKNFTFLCFLWFHFITFGQNPEGLSFEATTYDFGTIKSKTNAKAVFKFENISNSAIEILKIHGQGHCIEIDSSSLRTYAPKERGEILISYNISCKGPIRRTVSVFTSQKDNTITLKLIGKVSE